MTEYPALSTGSGSESQSGVVNISWSYLWGGFFFFWSLLLAAG